MGGIFPPLWVLQSLELWGAVSLRFGAKVDSEPYRVQGLEKVWRGEAGRGGTPRPPGLWVWSTIVGASAASWGILPEVRLLQGAGTVLCGSLGLRGLRTQRVLKPARRLRRRNAPALTMEFDCEGVRRLLGKVQAGGGQDGTWRSHHRASLQFIYFPPPISFFPRLFCCLDTPTHTVSQAGLEVTAILLL